MQIVLARHGRPKLGHWIWVSPHQLADWIPAYNAGGVFVDEAPARLSAKAEQSGWIVSSPLLRCMQSAAALAPSRVIASEEVFREAALPHGMWRFPPLPLPLWTVIFRAAWLCGYSGDAESLAMARIRARSAAFRLNDLAREHESVFLVGHGIMAALIAKELILQGWAGPKQPVHGYWQFSVYQKNDK